MEEEREISHTVSGSTDWAATMEKSMGFLKNLKIELSYDPVIPLLGM